MTLPALPSPQSVSPAELADYGAQVVAWAEQTESVMEVREAASKWAAITEYVRRTSRDGIAEAEAVLRRLEVRVGRLIGPAAMGRPTQSSEASELSRHERSDVRAMAEHEDIVEEVIANSTDERPPSRNRVLGAIRERTNPPPRRPPLTDAAERAGWELRRATERVERIVADDRLSANREQVTTHLRGHLTYAIAVCQDLLDRLDSHGGNR